MRLITINIKNIIIIFTLLISISLFAQDADKTVTLVVSGQGQTQDVAKQSALRNAIELAFGTFISSNTEILNDELVKDEIVSVSNGNIQKFEILSEVKIPDGEYSTTLKATVSVSKLTSFVESKGVVVEFKGSLFSFNIKQQKFNKENEEKSIVNLYYIVDKLASTSFDYEINVSNPVLKPKSDPEIYVVNSYISVFANNNFLKIPDLIYSTLEGLSLTEEEVMDYNNTGTLMYDIAVFKSNGYPSFSNFHLRSDVSVKNIIILMASFKLHLLNFVVDNSIYNYHILDNPFNVDAIYDGGFQVLDDKSLFYDKIRDSRSSMEYYNKIGLDINCKNLRGFNEESALYRYNDRDIDGWFGVPLGFFREDYSRSHDTSYFTYVDRSVNHVYGVTQTKEGVFLNFTNKSYNLSFSKIINKSELLRIYFSDYLSLDDVGKIKEYSVKPYNPALQLDLVKYNKEGIPTVEKY